MRTRNGLPAALIVAMLALAPAARAAAPHSPDGLAPPDAPAHWLPPEPWIYNHWLPYDETRLYRLLHVTRQDLWQQLRDDHRTLAGSAARHGWPRPDALAARARRRARPGGLGRPGASCERRAVRTHHPGPSRPAPVLPLAAPVRDPQRGAGHLRRHRRRVPRAAPARAQPAGHRPPARPVARVRAGRVDRRAARAHRRRRARRATSARGRRRCCCTASSPSCPRWLDQARYNGPPLTHRGALVDKPRDYASNPAISRDGRFVAYEAYRQKLPLAVQLGEIAVLRADVQDGTTALISRVPSAGATGPDPISAYNPTISGDGRLVDVRVVAGQPELRQALRAHRDAALRSRAATPRRAWTTATPTRPTRSRPTTPPSPASGTRMIFEAVRGGRTVVLARDLPTGVVRRVVAGARRGTGDLRRSLRAGHLRRRHADRLHAGARAPGRSALGAVVGARARPGVGPGDRGEPPGRPLRGQPRDLTGRAVRGVHVVGRRRRGAAAAPRPRVGPYRADPAPAWRCRWTRPSATAGRW